MEKACNQIWQICSDFWYVDTGGHRLVVILVSLEVFHNCDGASILSLIEIQKFRFTVANILLGFFLLPCQSSQTVEKFVEIVCSFWKCHLLKVNSDGQVLDGWHTMWGRSVRQLCGYLKKLGLWSEWTSLRE